MYEQINRNRRASWLLMVVVVAILAALGYVIGAVSTGTSAGGLSFLGLFGVVAVAWSLVAYFTGDKMALAVSGARRISHEQEPRLWNVVEEMTIAAGLGQPPQVYVIEDPAPNAFATGRDPAHSAIAVTRGLLDKLDRNELQGVVAHEMAHVRNYDIRFATLVGVLVGLIALVADLFLRARWFGFGGRRGEGGGSAGVVLVLVGLVFAIVAPLAARAVQFMISRRRELLADGTAVELTRDPLGLAGALQKIAADPAGLRMANRATAHLYIANPLRKVKKSAGLFDTHPPIELRIELLLAMARGQAPATAARDRRQTASDGDASLAPPSASP
ncbi:MAG TPA: M48 family metallopeptidase [Thermoleophilia bacterium]|nr:M48 family metallopeptidase [Thermoleophilia bacterium]HQG03188.1 M48 family metallopeptidase [Thermoleophilia bacterium]HQJ97001.1 M48 family metallopeptidase [Thermoleophilia bacterium]